MAAIEDLTARQRDCLRAVANHCTYKEIARHLGISDSAVEKHLRNAREKLGVETTADAARLFLTHQGEGNPQGGNTHLGDVHFPGKEGDVAHFRGVTENSSGVGDNNFGVVEHDHPLTPLQTLSLIGRVVLGSIVSLTLLIACAEGLKAVLT